MTIRNFLCISAVLGLTMSAFCAGTSREGQSLISTVTSDLFAKLGNDLLTQRSQQEDVAMTFLQVGILLDERSMTAYEQFLRGASRACGSRHDYSDTILLSLGHYLDRKADLEIAAQALACVINNANTRAQRESLLEQLLSQAAKANAVFGSDVATQLGLYAAEKADYTTAMKQFEYACQLNMYNLLACENLYELRSSQEKAAVINDRLVYLRLRLAVNPLDLQAIVEFGRAAYSAQLYEIAVDAFDYASSLYAWLRPADPLNDDILIEWAQSCYFISSRRTHCITLAERLRQANKPNLALESVAAMAAEKLGQKDQKARILSEASFMAEQRLKAGLPGVTAYGLGWFYCFGQENPEKALAWCNKAFMQNPEEPAVKSLMAYALFLNRQDDLAREYSEAVSGNNPIAALTLASLDIRNDQKQRAAESLKKILDAYLPLTVRNKAVALIEECGVEYSRNLFFGPVLKNLAGQFGEKIIPGFVSPDKLFSARLSFSGSEFSYGSTIEAALVVANTGSTPLIIGRGGLLTGRYRVDAVVGGDLNVKLPQLLEGAFRPARHILPGESISVRLDVNTGELKKILFTYPQASLEVKFRIYLDPVAAEDGTVADGIRGINPIEATIRRKGVVLTSEYLVQRLDALTKGQEGLKIRAAELFTGLYAEQMAYKSGTVRYRHVQTELTLLTDAVRMTILDENWKIRVNTLILLSEHSVPLDYAIIVSVSENLDHECWPVRLASLWLLTNQQKSSFQSVLDWKARNDPFWLNRRLAIALGGGEKPPVPADPNQKPPNS